MNSRIIAAHKFSINNREKLQKDKKCGCFYCLKIFSPKEITEYLQYDHIPIDKDGTALCPYCGIDSVLSRSAGFPLTEEFLKRMYRKWF